MSTRPQTATILVVDDTSENIMVLDQILRGEYKVKVARNGARALEIAGGAEPPDLILLDVMMPEMDGYEVIIRLKADPRTAGIPVIFVTALGEVNNESRGFQLGAVDYITKPVSPPIVLARVEAQLALYDQSRALDSLVRQRTSELTTSRLDILWRLSRAAEFRDEDTGNHVVRVGLYSQLLARHLGLDEDHVERIFLTSPLHDVGKIGISDTILLKPGKLTDDEFEIMRTHAAIGAAILREPAAGTRVYLEQQGLDAESDANPLLHAAAVIALSHHEKWNGQGYPNRLAGEDIPIEGRIVALADVYDALSSERPYKKAFPEEQVLSILADGAGSHFDPAVHAAFLEHLDSFRAIRLRHAD